MDGAAVIMMKMEKSVFRGMKQKGVENGSWRALAPAPQNPLVVVFRNGRT